jgi:hypothetical protein
MLLHNRSKTLTRIDKVVSSLGLRPWGSAELNTGHHLYPQKLALTPQMGGGRSVGMVRSRTKATELYSISISTILLCRTEWVGIVVAL